MADSLIRMKSVGTPAVLHNINNVSLLLVLNVCRIFPHLCIYTGDV
jgi:hypothetical protein